MLGYLYKIVPFLVWTHKYSEKVGKEKVPTLKEMMNEKLGVILYRLFTISIFGIIVSAAFSSGLAPFILRYPGAGIDCFCHYHYSCYIKINGKEFLS